MFTVSKKKKKEFGCCFSFLQFGETNPCEYARSHLNCAQAHSSILQQESHDVRLILRQSTQAHNLRTLERTTSMFKRTRTVGSINISSNAPALNQLQHKLERTHVAGSTTNKSAHLRSISTTCALAHLRILHQNGQAPEILPNLCLVHFVSFLF
jgi:hypothetical protein